MDLVGNPGGELLDGRELFGAPRLPLAGLQLLDGPFDLFVQRCSHPQSHQPPGQPAQDATVVCLDQVDPRVELLLESLAGRPGLLVEKADYLEPPPVAVRGHR